MKNQECSENTKECCAVMVPRADIYEGAKAVTVTVDLPGVERSNLEVTFERGELSILARREVSSVGAMKILHREFGAGSFHRNFSLADGLDAEKIDAQLRNGVLTLTIPRVKPVRPKKVEIRGVH